MLVTLRTMSQWNSGVGIVDTEQAAIYIKEVEYRILTTIFLVMKGNIN
jgi:hypothetical protein